MAERKPIPPLETITADTLLNTDYPPLQFSIEKLLPQGIFILAGSGKIGKSRLSLDMCVAVAKGSKLWEFNANVGEVLYLALEDTHPRLKDRLEHIADDENAVVDKLYLAVSSLGISDGLIEQIKTFIAKYPTTKLIVIDTLEHIRNTEQDKSMYACDCVVTKSVLFHFRLWQKFHTLPCSSFSHKTSFAGTLFI